MAQFNPPYGFMRACSACRSIHTMSLEANQVGERGGFAMADAIWQNTTLLALNMADNDLGEAADYIREAWGDRSDGLVL